MLKIICVAGARPNFMKIAPLMFAMRQHAGDRIDARLVHTGQHYDAAMSDVFFEQLGIAEPHANLGVGGGTREEQIERIMEKFDAYVAEHPADAVLVVGDVNSTIACVRVARQHGMGTIHVEAGLRSFDQAMPEEVNRIETDELSDLLFVTEPSGMVNLEAEGVPGQAFLVGNVMIDTLVKQIDATSPEPLMAELGLAAGEYVVATFHRPSNVDELEPLSNVVDIIDYAAARGKVFIPLHPRTRKSLAAHGLDTRLSDNANIVVTEPMGYVDFIGLVSRSRGIVTDSGGIQEESTYLQVPCITMRDNTERPVTVDYGTNVLAGTDPVAVKHALDELFEGRFKSGAVPELWDGRAAERIVGIICDELDRDA